MTFDSNPGRPTGAFYLEAKKSLSQNFLKDKNVIVRIVQSAEQCTPHGREQRCVEVGPGTGALTEALLARGWKVHCIEKDSRAVVGLKDELVPKYPATLTIDEVSILKWAPPQGDPCLCLGNLPYAISSDFFLWFYKHRSSFSNGLFMIQDEVAERLAAPPSTKAYGRLTVRMQLGFHVKKLFTVPPEAFTPRPRVNSAVVLLEPKPFAFESPEEDARFSLFTATLFSARRKMLRGTLPHVPESIWSGLEAQSIFKTLRPDALTPHQILEIFRSLNAKGSP